MIGLTFLGVKQRDAIKHIQSEDYKSRFVRKSGRVNPGGGDSITEHTGGAGSKV